MTDPALALALLVLFAVAATASAFQLSLVEAGVEDAHRIVPICFLVIAATVLVYGLGARPLARALGLTADGR
jgi:NhaP-type Na+/H+ or K+/H+ antiporter